MSLWSQEQILLFLELFQGESVIWDAKHAGHKDKKKIHDGWVRISEILNIPVEELKKKKESLVATYRGYHRKVQASIKSGAGVEDVYRPVWFAYNVMNQFLGKTLKCRQTINTEEPEHQEAEVHETPEISMDQNETNLTNDSEQTKTVRRRYNPPELQHASKQMTEAFSTLKNVINQRTTEEDECDIFGKLIAKKLKKLPENNRENIMFEIRSLFRERDNISRPSSADSFRVSSPGSVYSVSSDMYARSRSGTTKLPTISPSFSEPSTKKYRNLQNTPYMLKQPNSQKNIPSYTIVNNPSRPQSLNKYVHQSQENEPLVLHIRESNSPHTDTMQNSSDMVLSPEDDTSNSHSDYLQLENESEENEIPEEYYRLIID